ncbi:MAG: hypothetical protein K9N10_08505 [Deltaproteobacteria bacterium]|nr:hypothetical protein [Deltaproteobacteria bacterium]
MRNRFTAIVFVMIFLWAFQVHAGPMGDRPRIWPEFQYRDGKADSPFSGSLDEADDEISAMDLLFGEVEYAKKGMEEIALPSEEGRANIPVNAFIFTYGEYLHQWNIPQHQVPRETVVFQEKPFDYRGPPPEPEPPPVIPKEEGQKYRYPEELMEPVYQHPTGLADTFELEYALQLEKDAASFAYPFAPKDAPGPVQQMYRYGEVSPGTGAGGVGYGPAQQQSGYQYPAGGTGRGYGPGYGAEGEPQMRKKEGKKGTGGIDTFKGAAGVAKDRPYGMILLGAGLAAVASLFRMFRLSLFILVGWMVFYGKDLWLIILELQ